MKIEEFKRILVTFADNSDSIDISKGELLIQILDEVIEAEILQRDGSLIVRENGVDLVAEQWLIKRVARLPQLADRILSYIPEENMFVNPSGNLLDQLEQSVRDEREHIEDVTQEIKKVLGRRPAGISSVLYLTSDAGEGKTTLINQVARSQANSYKKKETDWLLVPIALSGRPFLRFDDIIVGALVNRFRFPFFYYDSFMELVRMGVLVPAFDGFEEMFVESSSGEALSALGNLLQNLDSSGTVLISARKAYFEYTSFANQAKLFDTIKSDYASFSSLSINRWSRAQFIKYCSKRSIVDGETIYNEVSNRFGEDHPLLTRAVLVKRLLDVAREVKERETLLDKLGQAPQDYFFQFVNAIIEREAVEKWIDRSGQLAKPLISVSEHHDLLSFIAQEMWLVNSDSVKDDALETIADIFSETNNKSPLISRQIRERIKQHALLTSVNNKTMFAFDHEEFKNFFLGQAVGRRIYENNISDLKGILRSGALPVSCYDGAIQFLKHQHYDLKNAIKILQDISQADIITSFTRENCGGLIIRSLDDGRWNNMEINNVTFPPNSLLSKSIKMIRFNNCYFQPTLLNNVDFSDCSFENCRFDRLELDQNMNISSSLFANCEVVSLVLAGNDNKIFDPKSINSALSVSGFTVESTSMELTSEVFNETDEELQILDKVLRCFLRSTAISENIMKLKLGGRANHFFRNALPLLLKNNIIIEAESRSDSKQSYYKLNIPMGDIDRAMRQSGGNFQNFLSQLSS